MGLGVLLQPGHQLADEVAPAHPQAAGADLPQQGHRPLREPLVGLVAVRPILHQDAPLDQAGAPELLQQGVRLALRVVDLDLHHAELPGLRQETADHGAGDPQFPGNIALLLVLQVVPAGRVDKPLLLFQTQFHSGAPFLRDVTYVTYSIKRPGMQGSGREKEAAAPGRRGGGKCKQIMNPLAFSAERAIIMLALIENEC